MGFVDAYFFPSSPTEVVVIEIRSENSPFLVCECVSVGNRSVFFCDRILCADFDSAGQVPFINCCFQQLIFECCFSF